MTRKRLAISKACFSLAIFLGFFLLCAFFFTYGKAAVQEAIKELTDASKTQNTTNNGLDFSGLGIGLGPAFLLIFSGIALICFALPELLFLISFSGNFAKQGSTKGFTIVSLIGEIFGVIIMFVFTACFFEATNWDVVAFIGVTSFDLLLFASFINSIFVLACHKKADKE